MQHYGSTELDASPLLLPLVGFLPADDPRVAATVDAVEESSPRDGLMPRHRTEGGTDGREGDEGTFLLCNFWLVHAEGRMLGNFPQAVSHIGLVNAARRMATAASDR